MNPLTPLPASNSQQFSLNKVDWQKIARAAMVQAASLFLTLGVPWLLNFKYMYRGTDYTPMVLLVVNGAAEALRRFVSGRPQMITLPKP
jgi:hypothetical protein